MTIPWIWIWALDVIPLRTQIYQLVYLSLVHDMRAAYYPHPFTRISIGVTLLCKQIPWALQHSGRIPTPSLKYYSVVLHTYPKNLRSFIDVTLICPQKIRISAKYLKAQPHPSPLVRSVGLRPTDRMGARARAAGHSFFCPVTHIRPL